MIIVNSRGAFNRELARLQSELGGRWAWGTGNTYPEDYTILPHTYGAMIRTGDAGGRETVAHIRIDFDS